MERTISEMRGEHKTNDFTMTDEQYKLYQQQRGQFSYTRDFLLTIRDSVAVWPKLPSVPDLITEEDTISQDTKNEDKFASRGVSTSNPSTFPRNRRREHSSDRDWEQINKDKHVDHSVAHDWRQEKESERDTLSRSDRDWKDKSDAKMFRRDAQANSERDKDWSEKKDRKEGWNYVGKTDFRSRRGPHTTQHETSEALEPSDSIVLGPPRKAFPSSQPGSNTNLPPPNAASGGPSKRHERNAAHKNSEKNYVNFATERPPTKRTANVPKGTRDESVEQASFVSKPKQFDTNDSFGQFDSSAKNEPSNFVDNLFQSETSQKFSWDELMTAFNGSLSLPKTQTTKFDTALESEANDSDQEVDDPVSVTASRAFGRWFSPEAQAKDTQKQKHPAAETAPVSTPHVTGKQNVDSDNSGNILQELLQTAIQGNKTIQMDQPPTHISNQTVQMHPPSESESFIASLLSKPMQNKPPAPTEGKIPEQYHQQAPPMANPMNMYGRPQQYAPQYPLHSPHSPHAPPPNPYYQMKHNAPATNTYFQPNLYQQQYPTQFHVPSVETSGPNLLEKLFGGAVQGSVSLPPLPQHGKVVSLEEIEKNQRK